MGDKMKDEKNAENVVTVLIDKILEFLKNFKDTEQYKQKIIDYLTYYFRCFDDSLSSIYSKTSHWFLMIIIIQIITSTTGVLLILDNIDHNSI